MNLINLIWKVVEVKENIRVRREIAKRRKKEVVD